jgi:hypothetical protein
VSPMSSRRVDGAGPARADGYVAVKDRWKGMSLRASARGKVVLQLLVERHTAAAFAAIDDRRDLWNSAQLH